MTRRAGSNTVDIGLRLKETLRAKVERAAKHRGASMNGEIVSRLEQSFEHQGLMREVLRIAYGSVWGDFLADAHANGVLTLRGQDKEEIRAVLNKFIDDLPEAKK